MLERLLDQTLNPQITNDIRKTSEPQKKSSVSLLNMFIIIFINQLQMEFLR